MLRCFVHTDRREEGSVSRKLLSPDRTRELSRFHRGQRINSEIKRAIQVQLHSAQSGGLHLLGTLAVFVRQSTHCALGKMGRDAGLQSKYTSGDWWIPPGAAERYYMPRCIYVTQYSPTIMVSLRWEDLCPLAMDST